jgi:transcriptional regulator with XRE-family HTH domain
MSLSASGCARSATSGKSTLSKIERGERALDSRAEIVALANALQISPSELIEEPVTAPGDEHPSAQSR